MHYPIATILTSHKTTKIKYSCLIRCGSNISTLKSFTLNRWPTPSSKLTYNKSPLQQILLSTSTIFFFDSMTVSMFPLAYNNNSSMTSIIPQQQAILGIKHCSMPLSAPTGGLV